jgi:chromosome segregation ATPase
MISGFVAFLIGVSIQVTQVARADSSVKSATAEFVKVQGELKKANEIKSLDRLLAQLDVIENQLQKAKRTVASLVTGTDAESRMQTRLMAKLAKDQDFLNDLKEDLGLAEQDAFDVYSQLRKLFLKDEAQRPQVKKMDSQILLAVERYAHEKNLNRL